MDFITEWGKIAGIAGLALGVFLVLFREVIRKNIFASLTKKQSYNIIIIFMILIWSLSIFSIVSYYTGDSEDTFQVTVFVHGENGKDDLILANRGIVKLIFGDASVEETINHKGEATFKQIPVNFLQDEKGVEILFFDPGGEPYKSTVPDSVYRLEKGKYISLEVKLFGLEELRGVVKDFTTGEYIEGARISIRGVEAFSDQYGEYVLKIPEKHQQKFQTVRAMKEGYQSFEHSNTPIQTESEFPILLKPVEK